MSRGLGKLQRTIKALIYAQSERFDRESAAADPEGDLPDCVFWLTWTDIRFHFWKNFDPSKKSYEDWLALERAAKRALHTLWKRGEIGRIRHHVNGLYCYMPIETYNESFSPQAAESLKQALERLEDADALVSVPRERLN